MKAVFYTHSLVSDWNHGNAHFLRGILRELVARGHSAKALEPVGAWSRANLLAEAGEAAETKFASQFPELSSEVYDQSFRHEEALADADLVVVHEWTDPALVARIGRARLNGARFTLLFHDTHHRAVSAEGDIAGLALDGYDGVLAFGEALRERYLDAGWGKAVFTWHEAADDRLFHPHPEIERTADLIWIGNWGDGERTAELDEYLMKPARALRLSGAVHGVRYPASTLQRLAEAGLSYRGWIANADVPQAFAAHRLTVHVPRRPYVERLPGIPTIRMFEALACGIPLVSAPWHDAEGLFRPGQDFLFARDGDAMEAAMRELLADPARREAMARSGLETVLARHTCRGRVDELFTILRRLGSASASESPPREAAA